MKLLLGVLAAFAMVAAIASAQSIPVVGPSTHAFSGSGQSNVWTCPNGQSSFQLTMPTGMTGTLTVTTSQSSTAPTPWPSPPIAYAPGPVFTNTLTNSGTLTLTLGSNYFINVTVSNYVSGSTTVIGSCSAATAGNPQLQTRYDVRAYGAKSNGTTDDSVAVQAAENACNAAGGGYVYFPAGTTLAQSITYYSDCQNVGAGLSATIVKLPASANSPIFISSNFASLTGTNSSAGVLDTGFQAMLIDGNKANESGSSPCVQYYGYNPIWLHVRIQFCAGDALYSEWGSGAPATPNPGSLGMINDLAANLSGGNGITWKGPHDAIAQNVVVSANAGDGLIVTGNGGGLVINGFHSFGTSQQYALYIDSGIQKVICNACIVEGATLGQLFIDGNENTFSGQMYKSATAAPDVIIGGTNGAGSNTISSIVSATSGQTAPILSFANDSGNNIFSINAFCGSSTTSRSGTVGNGDIFTWTSSGCAGTPDSFQGANAQFNTINSSSGSNLFLKANASVANTGAVVVNNNAGVNDTQGLTIYDGGTTNAVQIIPNNGNGIVTFTYPTAAPSASCIPGSIAVRTDTSATAGSESYNCRNVTGTGTWEPIASGFVTAQATAAPTIQPAYAGLTGAEFSGGVGVDGNLPPANGLIGGVLNTTPFKINSVGGASTTEPWIFNYLTACAVTTDNLFEIQVGASNKMTVSCSGKLVTTGGIAVGGASTSIPNHGTVSCTLTAGANTACGSVTVITGNVCGVTSTDSTQAGGTVHTWAVSLSGTTLTVKAYSSSAIDTSAVTGNVVCN